MRNIVQQGDCLQLMKQMQSNSVDAIVTDPPYGLSFMGKKWDYDVPSTEIWEEALRVIKPGGYLLAFAGTRTQHRMAVRIEDAGFEIRDMIAWVYGSGFPKSLNIGKAVDKLLGNEREVVGISNNGSGAQPSKLSNHETGDTGIGYMDGSRKIFDVTKGSSDFEGFGTALKPALEPITVARKPLSEKTVAENCLKWGVGGINIDGSRVALNGDYKCKANGRPSQTGLGDNYDPEVANMADSIGRFPANLIHDGSDEVVSMFPNTKSGATKKQIDGYNGDSNTGFLRGVSNPQNQHGDQGSAARFFYCAKASSSERGSSNNHPTVKPITLMEYLVKLVCRKGSIVLDPFAGSGTTAIACLNTGRDYILMEQEEKYIEVISKRIAEATKPIIHVPNLFDL